MNATVGVLAATSPAGPTLPSAPPGQSVLPRRIPDPAAYDTFEAFSSAVGRPYSNEFIMQQWSSVHGGTSR